MHLQNYPSQNLPILSFDEAEILNLFIGCNSRFALTLRDPLLFRVNEFRNEFRLIEKPCDHKDAVSRYLWDGCSTKARKQLRAARSGGGRIAMEMLLNPILLGPSIYDASRFAKVALSSEAVELLANGRSPAELASLNRLLLEDAYPDELARCPLLRRDRSNPLEYRMQLVQTAIFACRLVALPAGKGIDEIFAPYEEGWPLVLSAVKGRAGEWRRAKERIIALHAGEQHPTRVITKIRGPFADLVNEWVDFALMLFFRGNSYSLTMPLLDHLWKIVEESFDFVLGLKWEVHPEVSQHFSGRSQAVRGVSKKREKCRPWEKRDVVRDK